MKSTKQARPSSTPKKITYVGGYKPPYPMATTNKTPTSRKQPTIYPGAKCPA